MLGITVPKYDKCSRCIRTAPLPLLPQRQGVALSQTRLLDVPSYHFTGILSGDILGDSPGWYAPSDTSNTPNTLNLTSLIGVFIPLLIVAGYAQWSKALKGRRVNVVMAFTTVFFGLSVISVSNFRDDLLSPESDRHRTQHWIIGVRRVILGSLYRPPSMTIDQYFMPPYSTTEIVRSAIFQFQIVIADLIMVCVQLPSFPTTWSLTVS